MSSDTKSPARHPVDRANVLALMPIFPPTPGGGAQYAEFLANRLPDLEVVNSLKIITERQGGGSRWAHDGSESPASGTTIEYKLWRFNGLPRKTNYRYIAFALQNLQLALLIHRLRSGDKPTILLIHSAFFIHPTLLMRALQSLQAREAEGLRIVLDARDPAIPAHRLSKMKFLSGAIACGSRITGYLRENLPVEVPVTKIPVPVEMFDLGDTEVGAILSGWGLRRHGYLFTPNGIRDEKNFPVVFATWLELYNRGLKVDLAVAGATRDWHPRYAAHPNGVRLVNLGAQANRDVRALMKGAAAVINPSRVEGLPRSCVEAISLGAPTMLPSGIGEFRFVGRVHIADPDDPVVLAEKLELIIRDRLVPEYDASQHTVARVCSQYGEFLRGQLKA